MDFSRRKNRHSEPQYFINISPQQNRQPLKTLYLRPMRGIRILIAPFFLLLAGNSAGWAQFGTNNAGARTLAMGNTSLTLTDAYAAANNQAAMAFAEGPAFGVSALQYFSLSELTSLWGCAVLPAAGGAFGLSVHHDGSQTFRQTQAGVGYGRKLGENIAVGVQLDLIHTGVTDLGNGNTFTAEAALLYKPSPELSIGARAYNPFMASAGEDLPGLEISSLLAVGLTYQPAKQFQLSAEGEQTIGYDFNLKAGAEYRPVEILAIRGGWMSRSSVLTAGFGIRWQQVFIDLGAQFHPQLGTSPAIGIHLE